MFSDVPLPHLNKVSRTEERFICPSVTRQLRVVRGNIRHPSSNCSLSEVTPWDLCITHSHVSPFSNSRTYSDNNVCPWKSLFLWKITCFLLYNHTSQNCDRITFWVKSTYISLLSESFFICVHFTAHWHNNTNDAYSVMCFSVVFDEILGRPQKDSPTTSAPTVTQ